MQRTLAVILGVAGVGIAAMGLVISSADGAAMKFGAMGGGVLLAIVGLVLFRSTIKPEPRRLARDYKDRGKLTFGEDDLKSSAGPSGSTGDEEPKPKKSKTYDL